jgi:hypothetical protein
MYVYSLIYTPSFVASLGKMVANHAKSLILLSPTDFMGVGRIKTKTQLKVLQITEHHYNKKPLNCCARTYLIP